MPPELLLEELEEELDELELLEDELELLDEELLEEETPPVALYNSNSAICGAVLALSIIKFTLLIDTVPKPLITVCVPSMPPDARTAPVS